MLTMLRFDGEVWEIALGHDRDDNSVNVRAAHAPLDAKALAAGITHIQTDGRGGKTIAAHELRRLR